MKVCTITTSMGRHYIDRHYTIADARAHIHMVASHNDGCAVGHIHRDRWEGAYDAPTIRTLLRDVPPYAILYVTDGEPDEYVTPATKGK